MPFERSPTRAELNKILFDGADFWPAGYKPPPELPPTKKIPPSKPPTIKISTYKANTQRMIDIVKPPPAFVPPHTTAHAHALPPHSALPAPLFMINKRAFATGGGGVLYRLQCVADPTRFIVGKQARCANDIEHEMGNLLAQRFKDSGISDDRLAELWRAPLPREEIDPTRKLREDLYTITSERKDALHPPPRPPVRWPLLPTRAAGIGRPCRYMAGPKILAGPILPSPATAKYCVQFFEHYSGTLHDAVKLQTIKAKDPMWPPSISSHPFYMRTSTRTTYDCVRRALFGMEGEPRAIASPGASSVYSSGSTEMITRALKFVYHLFESLQLHHDVSVLHCDIKPGNIFLNWCVDGRAEHPVFGDYGLTTDCKVTRPFNHRAHMYTWAEMMGEVGPHKDVPGPSEWRVSASLTVEKFAERLPPAMLSAGLFGVVLTDSIGTRAYSAPESFTPDEGVVQKHYGVYSARSDVYALAVTVIETLSGCSIMPELYGGKYDAAARELRLGYIVALCGLLRDNYDNYDKADGAPQFNGWALLPSSVVDILEIMLQSQRDVDEAGPAAAAGADINHLLAECRIQVHQLYNLY